MRQTRGVFWSAAAVLLVVNPAIAQDRPAAAERPTFESDVAPILQAHCLKCHGAGKREAGLDLRRRFTMLAGGDSGPAIVKGKPQQSLLIEMIDDGLMPPEREPPLRKEHVAVLRRWISSGAAIAGKSEPPLEAAESPDGVFDENARRHWAFQPVRKPPLPRVANSSWVRTPVDAFTLAALQERGWRPRRPPLARSFCGASTST